MNKVKLKEYIKIIKNKDKLYVINDEVLSFPYSEDMEKLLSLLKNGISQDNISKLIKISKEDLNFIMKKLHEIDALIIYWKDYKNKSIHSKQLYFWEQFNCNPLIVQKKLTKKTIVIIGLGGLGGQVFQNLISAGIKNFILIDYDEVNIDNLNRQYIYNTNSIGFKKVDEAKKYAYSIDDTINITTYPVKLNTSDDLQKIISNKFIDLVVNAADTPLTIKNEVLKYCYKFKVPFVTGGIGIKTGHWGPLLDKYSFKNGAIQIKNNKKLKTFLESQTPIKGSSGFTNNIISSYLAYDIVMYLIDRNCHSYQRKCNINFNKLEIKTEENSEILYF